MFVGCFHSLNYNLVGLSILTSCAKVPGLYPVTGTFFVLFFVFFFAVVVCLVSFFLFLFFLIPCGIENSCLRNHHN